MKNPNFIAAEFRKGNGETVRIALDKYEGRPTLDLRVWYRPAHGEPRPSVKGPTTAAWHITSIKCGVDGAYAEAVKRGIIDADHLAQAEGR
jgi:hypothetical protein